jgi:hypothetical protein
LRKEQMAKQEVEKRRLCVVLQVKFLLQTLLQHEHIRKDLLSARNPQLKVSELQSLLELAELLGVKRDNNVRYWGRDVRTTHTHTHTFCWT